MEEREEMEEIIKVGKQDRDIFILNLELLVQIL